MRLLKDDRILDIQNRFTNQYPFLRLEFYKKEHAHFAGSPAKDQLSADKKFCDIIPDFEEVDIPISPEMSVSDLERSLEDKCHLHAQVFRKSGSVWLQTSSTDDWSLEKHSDQAEQAEKLYHERK